MLTRYFTEVEGSFLLCRIALSSIVWFRDVNFLRVEDVRRLKVFGNRRLRSIPRIGEVPY